MENTKQILDIETTGTDPDLDDILQLAIIDQTGKVLFRDYFRNERKSSWPKAERINHISPAMVRNKKTFRERLPEIQNIINQADELIAYNAQFDLRFLARAGIDLPDVSVSDPMVEFAEIYGQWDSYHGHYRWQKLETAAKYYGYEFKSHDSLEDVRATLFVYLRIIGYRILFFNAICEKISSALNSHGKAMTSGRLRPA